ncbi:MAG: anaerobic ribonucleoside-triphosphate reductase activating protein [Oscillospiraceae bacterium]|nr:anaerobic ribonucleoside-triphosphate reductase activating protein [Oscillospiraceae bacterium]
MKICGLQKLTLLDFPEHVACTVFLGGCNLRCPFCHNRDLVLGGGEELMGEEELLRFLQKRKGLLDGVCITGGEPLLWDQTLELAARIKDLGYLLKLDTNGFFPQRLRTFLDRSLADYIAMDIKSSPDGYPAATGLSRVELAPVEESVRLIRQSGVAHEFRTTVVRQLHGPEEMAAIGDWLAGTERYFLQGFVDSGALIDPGMSGYSKEEMEKLLKIVQKKIPNAALRGV